MNVSTNPRPRAVTVSVAILAILMVVGLVSSLLGVPADRVADAMAKNIPYYKYFQYSSTVIGILINAFFIYKIFCGKNWARVIYLVFFVIGLVFAIPSYLGVLHISADIKIYGSLRYFVTFIAMALLYTKPGKAWFSQQAS